MLRRVVIALAIAAAAGGFADLLGAKVRDTIAGGRVVFSYN